MKTEKHLLLASVIASHRSGKVAGRTRLQKTIKLLQRKGLGSDYLFSIFHYGPYSDGITSDITLLENLGLIKEKLTISESGREYYILKASEYTNPRLVADFQSWITKMEKTDSIILELAATYDAFREDGLSHDMALKKLLAKKGDKCSSARLKGAMSLLKSLELPTAST